MNLKSLSLIIAFLCTSAMLMAQSIKELPSGLYLINKESGIKLKHETTGSFYFIESAPFVSTKHLVSATAKTRIIRLADATFKKMSVLTLKFDTQSADAIKQATTPHGFTKPQTALVVNGKLKSVAEAFGAITNASIEISFGDYPIEKVQALAKEIEST